MTVTGWGVLALTLCSCASSGPPLPEIAPEINATLTEQVQYAVMPGDVISVWFTVVEEVGSTNFRVTSDPKVPDFDTTVREDGHASFSVVGDVPVAGLSLEALEAKIRESYEASLPGSTVRLRVRDRAIRNVVIMGQVVEPLEIPVDGTRLSLVEALGKAGGYNFVTACMESVLLVRWLPEERRQIAWRIDASDDYWGQGEPIFLQAHDVIYVPEKPVVQVGVFVDQYIRQMIPLPGFVY